MILLLIFPFSVFAKTYEVKNTNTKMTIDDKNWDVFTLDDTNDNEFLKKYHIPIEIAKKYAYKNNIFLQAEKTDFNDFLFVASLYPNEINEKLIDYDLFGSSIIEIFGIDNYEIYENNYKFIKIDFYDSENNNYKIQYHTIIDDKQYVFSAQRSIKFSLDEKLEIKRIIDSIKFSDDIIDNNDISGEIKDIKTNDSLKWKKILNVIIPSFLYGAFLSYFFWLMKNKKRY